LERVAGIASLALAIFANLCHDAISVDSTWTGFTENRFVRFYSGLTAVFFGFSWQKSGLALTGYGSVRLFDAFGVGAARVGFATGQLNCETFDQI
jgi:hypothetical protein